MGRELGLARNKDVPFDLFQIKSTITNNIGKSAISINQPYLNISKYSRVFKL